MKKKIQKLVLVLIAAAGTAALFTNCQAVPVEGGASAVSTAGQSINDLAAQATQAWVDYQHGDINYGWAAVKGLYALSSAIKTKDDLKAVVTAWSGSGTFAEKLARIFAVSTAPPGTTAKAIASGISQKALDKGP